MKMETCQTDASPEAKFLHWALLFSLMLMAVPVTGQGGILDELEEQDPCSIEIFSEVTTFQPGTAFEVGVMIRPVEGWHGYWHSSRDGGDAPEAIWTLPDRWTVTGPDFPVPQRMVEAGNLVAIGYKEPFLLRYRIHPAKESSSESAAVELALKVIWQVCKSTCIYGESEATVKVNRGTTSIRGKGAAILKRWSDRYPIPLDKARGFQSTQQWIPAETDGVVRSGTWVVRWSRKGDDRRPAVPVRWLAYPHGIEAGLISEASVRTGTQDSSIPGSPRWEVRFDLSELGVGFHPSMLGVTLVPGPGKAKGPVPGFPAITIKGVPEQQK